MEVKIKKEELLKGTGRAQAIAERRSSMQILSNLLLRVADSGLEVVATDLEIGFKGLYPAQVGEEGQVCLPARTFHSIIRELPAELVFLKEEDNHRVLIEGGRTRYHLAGLPADEFPALPQHEEVTLVDVSVEDLAEMLDKTIYSMAAEEGRYNLAGVYLEKIEEQSLLRMVSTDGHRLSLIDRPLDKLVNLDLARGAIIPRKGVLEMRRLLEEVESAQLGIKGSAAVLRVAEASLIMRLLESRFPDYRQVLPPDKATLNFTVKRPELLEALRRITILTTDKYRGIKLTVRPDRLVILHQNPDLGEAKESLGVDYVGDELTVGFNAAYLVDALKAMRSEEVTFSLTEPSRPTLVTGPADENFKAVIMPMQVA